MESGQETEAQKRRRLRQERIRSRGGDRLNRIKGTFSEVQSDMGAEIGMVGGHELTTGCAESADSDTSAKPRRRAGNLARKARLEAEAVSSPLSDTRSLPEVSGSSSALDETLAAEIDDPAARLEPVELGEAVVLPSRGRRFSGAGLVQSLVRLVPVASVFVYGVRREAAYERLLGDDTDDVRVKWTGLVRARPDARLDEWAPGNYLLFYVLVVEGALYGLHLALNTQPTSWPAALLPAARRMADSLSLLLFFTALSILAV